MRVAATLLIAIALSACAQEDDRDPRSCAPGCAFGGPPPPPGSSSDPICYDGCNWCQRPAALEGRCSCTARPCVDAGS